ncbi:hypothetical protein GCM10010468_03270 [Actinocorallia longicatena]|uniref:Uncharacterized protein n=1 Tax=Actinocorallia longicatena TaxID=111803 RepID=A0ABP6PWB9_9ACTN
MPERRVMAGILLTMGVFGISAAFLVRFQAADALVKAPVGIEMRQSLVGAGSYLDLAGGVRVPDARIATTRTLHGIPDLSVGGTAVWDSFAMTEDEGSGTELDVTSWRLAFDRRSGLLTGCCGASVAKDTGVRQSGLGYVWPIGAVGRGDHQVFDPVTGRAWPAVYSGEEKVGGIGTYRFVQRIPATPVAEIKGVSGRLFGLDRAKRYDADRTYEATVTLWVDPRTGWPVDRREETVAKLVTRTAPGTVVLATTDVRLDEAGRADAARRSLGYAQRIRAATIIVPAAAGTAGTMLVCAGAITAGLGSLRPRRLRALARALRPVLGVCAVGFLAVRLYEGRAEVGAALDGLSYRPFAAALALVVAGLVCMMLAWRTILADLGSPLPRRRAARVMFLGQLGKYVPGSVWSVVGMAELGSDEGVPRRRTLAATAISLAITLACALALSITRLPALYWPVLVAVVVGLHPRALTLGVGALMRLTRRDPLERTVSGRGVLRATGWTVLGWTLWGSHVWVLAAAVAPDEPVLRLWPLAVGVYALAWASGILFLLAPAGLGVLDGALVLGLTPALGGGAALTVAVVTRAVLVLADLVVAVAGILASAQFSGRKSTELT